MSLIWHLILRAQGVSMCQVKLMAAPFLSQFCRKHPVHKYICHESLTVCGGGGPGVSLGRVVTSVGGSGAAQAVQDLAPITQATKLWRYLNRKWRTLKWRTLKWRKTQSLIEVLEVCVWVGW